MVFADMTPRVDLVMQQYQTSTYDVQIYKITTERSLQKHSRHERRMRGDFPTLLPGQNAIRYESRPSAELDVFVIAPLAGFTSVF